MNKIFSTTEWHEARSAKLLLDEHGIEAEVMDEHMSFLYGASSPAFPFVIYVKSEEEVRKAQEILEDHFDNIQFSDTKKLETDEDRYSHEAKLFDMGWVINTLKNISRLREKIDKHRFLIDLMCFYLVYTFMIFAHHFLREPVFHFVDANSKHLDSWYHMIWKGFDSLLMNEIPLLGFPVLMTMIVFIARDYFSEQVKWYFLRVFTVLIGLGLFVHIISIFLHFS